MRNVSDLVAETIIAPHSDRLAYLRTRSAGAAERVEAFCGLGLRGLTQMHQGGGRFPHTMRRIEGTAGVRPEGGNLRYTINVAQGLSWLDEDTQKRVLGGATAAELALAAARRALSEGEMGAVALAAWAVAEVANIFASELFNMLEAKLAPGQPVATVSCAWALTAALAARRLGDTSQVKALASSRLQGAQAENGLFAHVMPASASGWARAHVGCFADQVYPIQALARLGYADSDAGALAAAEACAARIVALQGPAGQWWWHYDVRDGSVVEGYPVYSVHQHAMGPMALLDLWEAGGTDHFDAIIAGLGWLDNHPETADALVSEADAMIWRKVGRREPTKLVRRVSAITTSLRRGWHLPGLDVAFPPVLVDHECRPYEFGWLLNAWTSRDVVGRLRLN